MRFATKPKRRPGSFHFGRRSKVQRWNATPLGLLGLAFGSALEKAHLVVGPLRLKPCPPAACLCFHHSGRDCPEFFSCRECCFAPPLPPHVRNSSQLLDR